MAHIGRDYRLAFRRDYGINQFTENGPAQSYRVTIGEFTYPSLPDEFAFFFRGRNNLKGSGEGRIWTFDPIALGGVNFSGDVRISNDPNDGITECIVDIFSDFHGLEFSGRYVAVEGNPYIWSGFAFFFHELLFDRGDLIPSRFVAECTFDAWFWVDGP